MKLIPLSQDKYACVDDADYGWISKFRWSAEKVGISRTFYAATQIGRGSDKRTVRMHQLLCPFAARVDHINRNGLCNTRGNLRSATGSQNVGNTAKWASARCTSRFKGVCRLPGRKKYPWMARAGNKYAGTHACEIEAAKAYDKAALEVFGEFARLNFPAEGQSAALGQH